MWLMVHDTLCVGSNISVMVTSLHPALPWICQSDLYDLYCQVLKVTLQIMLVSRRIKIFKTVSLLQ